MKQNTSEKVFMDTSCGNILNEMNINIYMRYLPPPPPPPPPPPHPPKLNQISFMMDVLGNIRNLNGTSVQNLHAS